MERSVLSVRVRFPIEHDTHVHRFQSVRKILQRLRVTFEERDVQLSKDYAEQLRERLPGSLVPQVFFNGRHIGVRTKFPIQTRLNRLTLPLSPRTPRQSRA